MGCHVILLGLGAQITAVHFQIYYRTTWPSSFWGGEENNMVRVKRPTWSSSFWGGEENNMVFFLLRGWREHYEWSSKSQSAQQSFGVCFHGNPYLSFFLPLNLFHSCTAVIIQSITSATVQAHNYNDGRKLTKLAVTFWFCYGSSNHLNFCIGAAVVWMLPSLPLILWSNL